MEARRISIGAGAEAREIAYVQRPGGTPGLFWLGGFKSEMTASKAETLDTLGAEMGLAVTRFDYSGHGISGGAFLDGTISRWLEEALAVFALTTGPQIVIGSSMGGWLALLLNKTLRKKDEHRIRALVPIAPAVDMTEDLMRAKLDPAALHGLHASGRIVWPSDHSVEPLIVTERLIVDGAQHLLMGHGSIVTGCPVVILQGGKDIDVPVAHTLKLLSHLTLDPVTFTLIPDGEHRLSRPEDLERLKETIRRLVKD